jgi:hypothetical protein
MSSVQYDEERNERIHKGAAWHTPEHWEQNHHRLTMTMLDTLELDEDEPNVLATTIYRHMKSDYNTII